MATMLSLDDVNQFALRVSQSLEPEGSLAAHPLALEGTLDTLRPDQLPQARDILRRLMTLVGALEQAAAEVRRELDVVHTWTLDPSDLSSRYLDSKL